MDKIVEKIMGLIKEVKKKDIDPKLLDWIEKKYGPWDDRDFLSNDLDTYFKTDPTHKSEGGGTSHKIIRLPSFSELIKQLKSSRDAANDLVKGESVRDDEVLRDIYDDQRVTFNKFRTHLRKEYPAFYSQLKGQLTEEEIDEMSTTGGGAGSATFTGGTGMQYATPYAFKKKKKEKIDEDSQVRISEPRFVRDKNHPNFLNVYIDYSIGAGGSSIALGKETMTGQIRRKSAAAAVDKLNNIAKDLELKYNIEDIEVTDLENGKARLFAVSDDFINGVKEGVGATLGPGPKASKDGVKDNAYIKQFKYSLVPKKIKGSGLEVKQLFEADDVKSFQQERIAAFDVIEQQLNDIYKMLSNAKNETGDYYTENPTSFSVIKPTDLILDYIKDIKDLLKGE
jgi:hypothetical protein